jgi:PAS domain-containing protein
MVELNRIRTGQYQKVNDEGKRRIRGRWRRRGWFYARLTATDETTGLKSNRRKLAEEALRESEKKFRELFERVPVGLFQSSIDGRLLDANPEMARVFGYESPAAMFADGARVCDPQRLRQPRSVS